jgi:hypothetical protein
MPYLERGFPAPLSPPLSHLFHASDGDLAHAARWLVIAGSTLISLMVD